MISQARSRETAPERTEQDPRKPLKIQNMRNRWFNMSPGIVSDSQPGAQTLYIYTYN